MSFHSSRRDVVAQVNIGWCTSGVTCTASTGVFLLHSDPLYCGTASTGVFLLHSDPLYGDFFPFSLVWSRTTVSVSWGSTLPSGTSHILLPSWPGERPLVLPPPLLPSTHTHPHPHTLTHSGTPVGLYLTSTPEACCTIAQNCKANIIIVENESQLNKILQVQ